MARPTTNWKRVVADFATTYLVPVVGVFVLVLVGLGILGLVGLGLRLVLPVAVVALVLAVVSLLAAEMVWRLVTFNALLGLVSIYFAVHALVREFVPAFVGLLLGILTVLLLHFYGDPEKSLKSQAKQTVTDATGHSRPAVIFSGTKVSPTVGAVAFGALLLTILCWVWREHGTWNFFLTLFSSLALGRAVVWIVMEADTQTLYFWHPFAFLREVPGFAEFFRWWRQVRSLLGIGIAYWAQD